MGAQINKDVSYQKLVDYLLARRLFLHVEILKGGEQSYLSGAYDQIQGIIELLNSGEFQDSIA